MDYLHIYDRLTGKRLAILENAFDISYKLNLNPLSTASFSLPADDPKNQYCQPLNYVEVWDEGRRIDLFRILPMELKKDVSTKAISYSCEQVLATLLDDCLPRYHEMGGNTVTTAQSLRYVLDHQTVKRWELLGCAFTSYFSYAVENENLLAAFESILSPLAADWMLVTDTSASPWTISVAPRPEKQAGELRYGKNMNGITKHTDPSDLATRLYMYGYGEGDNQLGLEAVTDGKGYIESDTIERYGVISKIAVDRSIQDADILLSTAKALLAECSKPYLSYTVTAAAVSRNERPLMPGDMVRVIDDEEGISELFPVISVEKRNVNGTWEVVYEIANKSQDLASTLSGLSERQRISDLYSQGSTNIDSLAFTDNASDSKPAAMKFYVSDKVMRLNAVYLTFQLSPFRAYSTGAESGGGSATATGGGGSTSVSGGSTVSSSAAGSTSTSGGSVQSSSYTVTDSNGNVTASGTPLRWYHETSTNTDKAGGHYHMIWDWYMFPHSHTVDTRHSHSIGSHTHTVTIPSHKHGIEYGIYTGSSAKTAELVVDGVQVGGSFSGNVEIDILPYLSKDDGGRIRRNTWHKVEIRPAGLSRVEAFLQQICFINPRGGKDL